MLVVDILKHLYSCRAIKVGDPNDASNMMGALVSKEHLAKVRVYTVQQVIFVVWFETRKNQLSNLGHEAPSEL